jgi:hypothetical protein
MAIMQWGGQSGCGFPICNNALSIIVCINGEINRYKGKKG